MAHSHGWHVQAHHYLWTSPWSSSHTAWWLGFTGTGLKNMKVKVTQSCPTHCDTMYCSLTGSSVHRILQARILEWVAVPFSRGSSQPRDQTQVSHIAGKFFTIWATREAPEEHSFLFYKHMVFLWPRPGSQGVSLFFFFKECHFYQAQGQGSYYSHPAFKEMIINSTSCWRNG